MSQQIRNQGGHLIFPIGRKNTNFVEEVQILFPVKFIEFRSAVSEKSKMSQPIRGQDSQSCFFDRPKKTQTW